ncbi:MAG: nucleoside-diphosphate kinase [Candidatus Babeliaceae bacterium]|nr:nucleoside-diphosphate kinase [Candidatus Babeliaceae bacterium]
MMQKTFGMIKPGPIAAKEAGEVIRLIELNGFNIIRMEKRQLSKQDAERFYAVHQSKPFFGELVEYITSGPVIIMALERENAITEWRNLMGATDPSKAAVGTLRKMFGENIGNNAVHGSDAPETATLELGQFFPDLR